MTHSNILLITVKAFAGVLQRLRNGRATVVQLLCNHYRTVTAIIAQPLRNRHATVCGSNDR